MALFHTTVLDNQIKVLPTVDTASGSIASFNTDLTENLVSVKCQIVATQSGSGTPSPSNPRPIQTYTSLNLSHSGADTSNPNVTNIPFGQTVANGVLDITTGKLSIETLDCDLSSLTWNNADYGYYSSGLSATIKRTTSTADIPNLKAEKYATTSRADIGSAGSNNITVSTQGNLLCSSSSTPTGHIVYELATPQEIQLDSITLQALLNENNIWCDTGDTEVKYLLTVGKKIS